MPANGTALALSGVTKRFGGLVAVDNVTIDLASRRLNAIIGPNGAGKTTLFNLITGELRADSGRATFDGRDILGLKPHQVVRCGISRTLQIKSVFGGLSVMDNVRVAVLTHERVMRCSRWRSPLRQNPSCCCSTSPYAGWGRRRPSVRLPRSGTSPSESTSS
jgi:ABC-type branched-subunit amino acid transport system ATPase component